MRRPPRPPRRASFAIRVALGIGTLTSLARAQSQPPSVDTEPTTSAHAPLPNGSRPFTKAEIGLGGLTVPRASFRLPNEQLSKQADLTLLLVVKQSFHFNERFALGADVAWGLRPTSDRRTLDTPDGPLDRLHSRNYFSVEGFGQYYPVVTDQYELWASLAGGVVVVSDRYNLDSLGTSIVGPTSTTVSSEGATVGVGLGFDWRLGARWSLGLFTQEMLWFLPKTLACAQTLECATLGGQVFSFELGLNVAYQLRL